MISEKMIKKHSVTSSPFEHHSFGHETWVEASEYSAKWAQAKMLEMASDGFNEWQKSFIGDRPFYNGNTLWQLSSWQAATLSSEKRHQLEKDSMSKQIEELRSQHASEVAGYRQAAKLKSEYAKICEEQIEELKSVVLDLVEGLEMYCVPTTLTGVARQKLTTHKELIEKLKKERK